MVSELLLFISILNFLRTIFLAVLLIFGVNLMTFNIILELSVVSVVLYGVLKPLKLGLM